jgi:HlyD family secretion protein
MTQSSHPDEYVSAEHLDRLLQITRSRGWLALFALCLLILAAVFWGIFGSVPTLVRGKGVLIRTGGVFEVVAMSSGQLRELTVDVNDSVRQDEVIGWIAHPDLEEQIKNAKADIEELETEDQNLKKFTTRELALNQEHAAATRLQLEHAIKYAQERLKWLQERAVDQKILAEKGLITKQRLLDTKAKIDSTMEEIESNRNQLKALTIQTLQFEESKRRALQQSELDLAQKKRDLQRLQADLKVRSQVVSPYTGRVLELAIDVGKRLEAGEPILRMELSGESIKRLETVLFVSPESGKQVDVGMTVNVSPSTVKQEEYGFMLGKVTYVAAFPSSRQAMMRVLQNEDLVQTLSAGSAPIQIYVDLIPDQKTVSGFKWSSKHGPPLRVFSGTLCKASITVSEQAPISLLIPAAKKALFGGDTGP